MAKKNAVSAPAVKNGVCEVVYFDEMTSGEIKARWTHNIEESKKLQAENKELAVLLEAARKRENEFKSVNKLAELQAKVAKIQGGSVASLEAKLAALANPSPVAAVPEAQVVVDETEAAALSA